MDFNLTRGRLTGDGFSVRVKRIGKGTFAVAYLGSDGMAYLFVEGGDSGKDILSDIATADERSPYLPRVEALGETRNATLYRMPFYEKIMGRHKKAWSQALALQACCKEANWRLPGSRGFHSWMESAYMQMDRMVECSVEASALPPGMTRALTLLRDSAVSYGSDHMFEFPYRNLAVHSKGKGLVLLDVVFGRRALAKVRGF